MEKMRFEDFTQAVVEKIREYLPDTFRNAVVELQTVVKNNDLTLTGLTIRSQESGACPLIYLEQFFDAYNAGEEMGEVLEKIAEVRVKNDVGLAFDAEQVTDFERVKRKIVPRLIGRAWNENLLSGRPFTEIADLAATYHIQFSDEFSVPITNSLMEGWDVTAGDLHDLALENMERLMPSKFAGMSAMLFGDAAEVDPEDEAMFVLTNETGTFGAAAVLDKAIMEKISGMFGSFYLLPSSVHEWIVVPKTQDVEAGNLKSIVMSANASVVSPEDRLSDHVYVMGEAGLQIAG